MLEYIKKCICQNRSFDNKLFIQVCFHVCLKYIFHCVCTPFPIEIYCQSIKYGIKLFFIFL